MTRPGPPGSVTHEDGSRFYEVDGDKFWSVTTALKVIGSEGLVWWSAGLAAQAALDELPKLALSIITKPCGNTYSKCRQGKGDNGHDWRITCDTCPCTRCRPCVYEWMRRLHSVTKDERADEGRRVHDWVEEWVLSGGKRPPIHDDIAPYIRAFLAFVTGYGLQPDDWLFTEATVINREYAYAGTADGAIRIWARRTDLAADLVARVLQIPKSAAVAADAHVDVIVDVKTKSPLAEGASVKVYPEVALQMAPYRHATVIRLKHTGEERPMPPLDGALALLLYPDQAVPRLCVSDLETLGAFLGAFVLYRWMSDKGTASVSEKSFPLPPESAAEPVATVKAPGTRAPRKTAKATAAASKAKSKKEVADKATAQPLPGTSPIAVAAAQATATLASITRPDRRPGDRWTSIPDDEIPF